MPGIITREVLTKKRTDWVDYWAVDFDYESRKEIIKVEKGSGVNVVQGYLTGQEPAQREMPLPVADFEERWTGAYIFENEWQSFRTRQSRELELTTVAHTYAKPGRYLIAVKGIDIFGNDTMTLMPVTVGGEGPPLRDGCDKGSWAFSPAMDWWLQAALRRRSRRERRRFRAGLRGRPLPIGATC